METVQLPCNHCGELMAVSVEHMGMQVHCPHCQGVVQVPAKEVMSDKTWLDKPAEPSEKPAPPRPLVEAPKTIQADATEADLFRDVPLRPPAGKDTGKQPSWMEPAQEKETDDEGELPELPHIRRERPSMLVPILLLFLIPYALATTGFIAYLLYHNYQSRLNAFDPLERLPDPDPGKGGPLKEQVKHDSELPPQLKTHLKQAVRVGDLEVTPTRVQWTKKGDLTLDLTMQNVSQDLDFCPMLDEFCAVQDKGAALRPYTFVQSFAAKSIERPRGGDRLYGCTLKVVEDGKEKKLDPSRRLRPGKEMTIRLTTRDADRKRAEWMKNNPQELLWRVQVRRGLLPTRDGPRSATAVVGVQFNTSAIEE